MGTWSLQAKNVLDFLLRARTSEHCLHTKQVREDALEDMAASVNAFPTLGSSTK